MNILSVHKEKERGGSALFIVAHGLSLLLLRNYEESRPSPLLVHRGVSYSMGLHGGKQQRDTCIINIPS